jgi:hypothetical protein
MESSVGAGLLRVAWSWLKQTDLIPDKRQFPQRFPQSAQLLLSDNDFSGFFDRLRRLAPALQPQSQVIVMSSRNG